MLRTLVKNSTSNVSVNIIKMVISFIMAPVVVKALGNYDYGLWELVFSFTGYMSLMDIGMRPAVTRYVARYNAKNDRASLEKLFSTAFTFNATIGVIACSSLVTWALLNPEVLAAQDADPKRYMFFLAIVGVQVLFQFPGYVAECFHEGYQRHYLKNNITIVNTIIGSSILYYLLTHDYGLVTLALGSAISICLKYIIFTLLLIFPRFGAFRVNLKDVSLSMVKILLTFGSKTFIQSLASVIAVTVGSVTVGIFLGPAMVPFFSIPARLITYVTDMSMTATNAFLPMFSHLHSKEEYENITKMYLVSTKYILGITFPLLVGVSLLGKAFIARWIGEEYIINGTTVMYLLLAGHVLMIMNPLHQRYLTAINSINVLAKMRVYAAVTILALAFILVHPLGKEGVALAFLLTAILFEPYILLYTCRQLNITVVHFLQSVIYPLIIPCSAMGLLLLLANMTYTIESYVEILTTATLCSLVYIVFFYFISISREEKDLLLVKIKQRVAR
ncbi:MAG: oligosaccharide flippase family protein [Proteobacteria bacterium]|nr:oligosaccharide flippase family protein [Pseudomonadota bacterium]